MFLNYFLQIKAVENIDCLNKKLIKIKNKDLNLFKNLDVCFLCPAPLNLNFVKLQRACFMLEKLNDKYCTCLIKNNKTIYSLFEEQKKTNPSLKGFNVQIQKVTESSVVFKIMEIYSFENFINSNLNHSVLNNLSLLKTIEKTQNNSENVQFTKNLEQYHQFINWIDKTNVNKNVKVYPILPNICLIINENQNAIFLEIPETQFQQFFSKNIQLMVLDIYEPKDILEKFSSQKYENSLERLQKKEDLGYLVGNLQINEIKKEKNLLNTFNIINLKKEANKVEEIENLTDINFLKYYKGDISLMKENGESFISFKSQDNFLYENKKESKKKKIDFNNSPQFLEDDDFKFNRSDKNNVLRSQPTIYNVNNMDELFKPINEKVEKQSDNSLTAKNKSNKEELIVIKLEQISAKNDSDADILNNNFLKSELNKINENYLYLFNILKENEIKDIKLYYVGRFQCDISCWALYYNNKVFLVSSLKSDDVTNLILNLKNNCEILNDLKDSKRSKTLNIEVSDELISDELSGDEISEEEISEEEIRKDPNFHFKNGKSHQNSDEIQKGSEKKDLNSQKKKRFQKILTVIFISSVALRISLKCLKKLK